MTPDGDKTEVTLGLRKVARPRQGAPLTSCRPLADVWVRSMRLSKAVAARYLPPVISSRVDSSWSFDD